MSLVGRAIAKTLPVVPRPVVRRISRRYIAGPELADACRAVRELNEDGKRASIDVLGEEVTRREEALALVREYVDALEAIARAELDADVSVKLTGFGLKLDLDFCHDNLVTVVQAAAERGNQVEIDMEDSSTTSDTLALYRRLREEGHANVGIVLQATLRRTLDDVIAVADLKPRVRVCKGIYVEPAPLAYTGDETVRFNFVKTVECLLDAGAYVAVATHDEWLVEESLRLIEERGLRPEEYELQMLLGVKPELGDRLIGEGHRLRVYVPYGRQWFEYSVRRLQENPAIATTIALDTLRRLRPRGS